MSKLEQRKSRLTFETADAVRERGKLREVIFECDSPFFCNVRLKGLRGKFSISYAAIYHLAVMKEVERKRAEKKKLREFRKKTGNKRATLDDMKEARQLAA